jgi:hypothetical protein
MFPWRIILIGNNCGEDLTSCSPSKPPTPNKSGISPSSSTYYYYNKYNIKPPFVTYIVSKGTSCEKKADSPAYCRFRVVYDN